MLLVDLGIEIPLSAICPSIIKSWNGPGAHPFVWKFSILEIAYERIGRNPSALRDEARCAGHRLLILGALLASWSNIRVILNALSFLPDPAGRYRRRLRLSLGDDEFLRS